MQAWHRVRIDGGAGSIHWWTPFDGKNGATSARGEWPFTYRKPGPYRAHVDLVDANDYRAVPWASFRWRFPHR